MSNLTNNCFSPLFFIIFILTSCTDTPAKKNSEERKINNIQIYGETQGTTYGILCNDSINIDKSDIDSILSDIDQTLSLWIDTSTLSSLNNAPEGIFSFKDPQRYFIRCYELSDSMYRLTNGAFDPTIGIVFKLWDFDSATPAIPDSAKIENAINHVSFKHGVNFELLPAEWDSISNDSIYYISKKSGDALLDFNAIAQGLSVDIISEYLESKNASNYLVEIGGELKSKGKNAEGNEWRVGIDQPIENSSYSDRSLTAIANISGQAIATSGNYRKFFEFNGEKYGHTINPKTGYPVKHKLLSTTVIAPTAAMADAFSTAFMVMGTDSCKTFIEAHPELNLKTHLIYLDSTTGNYLNFTSKAMENHIEEVIE